MITCLFVFGFLCTVHIIEFEEQYRIAAPGSACCQYDNYENYHFELDSKGHSEYHLNSGYCVQRQVDSSKYLAGCLGLARVP